MKSLNDLKIQIFADGADKAGILELYAKPYIKGLTTNPSLMKKAGIKDYEAFAKDILQSVTNKPISLEVFTDDIVRHENAKPPRSPRGAKMFTPRSRSPIRRVNPVCRSSRNSPSRA